MSISHKSIAGIMEYVDGPVHVLAIQLSGYALETAIKYNSIVAARIEVLRALQDHDIQIEANVVTLVRDNYGQCIAIPHVIEKSINYLGTIKDAIATWEAHNVAKTACMASFPLDESISTIY